MTEEIMTQIPTEGQPAFPVKDTENDNSADSSTDKTNIDQTDSSDQDKTQTDNKNGDADKDNLDNHPRWKEREDDWTKRFNDQEVRHTQELEKLRTEFTGKFDGIKTSAPQEIPSWFGGDEQAWKDFTNWNNQALAKAKEEARTEALKDINSKSEAEENAIKVATDYFTEQVGVIEFDKTINPKGEKVDRNKLLKYTMDNDLVDSKGRWNYKAAFIMMRGQSTKANDTTDRKKLASDTTSDNRAETKPPAFMTSEDFSKPGAKPW